MGQKDETRRPVVVGDAVRDGYLLWVSCEVCQHRVQLVPADLAAFVGYDCALTALPMKCGECDSRDIAVRVQVVCDGAPTEYLYSKTPQPL